VTTKCKHYWKECSISAVIPSASTSNVMGQHNKMGAITFGAPIIHSHISYERLLLWICEQCQALAKT
jgi:hypothetical protein